MRCAWFLGDLGGGGAERLPLLLAPSFRDVALELVLLKNRIEHVVPDAVPRVTALLPAEKRLGRNAITLVRGATSAARGADVIVGGLEWDATIVAAVAGLRLRTPVVAIVHTDLERVYEPLGVPRWRWSLYEWALRRCARVVGVSHDALRSASKLGVPEARLRHVPNPAPQVPAWERHARSGGVPWQILTVGRLLPVKGVDVMLRAAARLGDIDQRWDFLGEGPERARLESGARALPRPDRVRFHGFVRDAASFFGRADLFVMASRMEGMPLALTEAFAHGVPVVTTRWNAEVAELVGEGEGAAGLLVPVDDDAALAAAIRRALESHEDRARWSRNARARAAELDPARIAARYEAVLRETLSPAGALGSA